MDRDEQNYENVRKRLRMLYEDFAGYDYEYAKRPRDMAMVVAILESMAESLEKLIDHTHSIN